MEGHISSPRFGRRFLSIALPLLGGLLVFCASAGAKTFAPITFTSSPPSSPVAGIGSYEVSATSIPGSRVTFRPLGACSLTPRQPGLVTPLEGSGDPIGEFSEERRPSPATIYFIGAGVCTITPIDEFEGKAAEEYETGPAEPQRFLVAKNPADQISFATTAPTHATVGETYEPAVRSSAGVLPWISVATPTVCEVLGEAWTVRQVTFIAPGTCTIDANQAADVNEEPAGPMESAAHQSFTVSAPSTSLAECGIPASARAELLKDALSAATESGDSHPYDIEAVRTTSSQAQGLRGASRPQEPPDTPVYFLAMRGEFQYNGPSPPAREGETAKQEAPLTVITLESYATSPLSGGGGESWSRTYPDLASLGTPVNLDGPQETPCMSGQQQSPTVTSEPLTKSEPLKLQAAPTVQQRSAIIKLKPSLGSSGTLAWRLTYESPEGATRVFATGTMKISDASTPSITVKPSAAALRALKNGHGLSVNVRLTFQPSSGSPATLDRTIMVRRQCCRGRTASRTTAKWVLRSRVEGSLGRRKCASRSGMPSARHVS